MNQIQRNKIPEVKVCFKCHGEKWYPIKEDIAGIYAIEVLCEFCCTHPQGFNKLTHYSYGLDIGKFGCKSGCGYVVAKIFEA